MSKLLKEAIADAKAVRETALANARLALEEAFAPRLQSMLTKKLREEELEGAESEETSDEVEEGSYYEDDEEVDDVVADEEPDVEAPAEEEPAEEAPVEEPAAEEAPSDEEEFAEDDLEAEFSADEESVEEDEFDLDSIIKELEDELASDTYEEEPVEEQSDSSELGTGGEEHVNVADSDDEDLPDDTEVQNAQVGEEDEEMPKVADIDEDIDIEIVDEEAAAGDESDEPTATESDEELAFPTNEEDCNQGGDIGEDDEEINLEEILKELEDETLEDETEDEGSPEIEELKVSNTKLQKENEEYRKVYKYLRGKLNEVNLLNAKLLYTNKLFKAHVLSEDQKLKVVESFDLTKNVREAKLVYATLGESFRSSTKETAPVVKRRASSTKKSLTEGMASKPIKSTKPSKKILSEGNDLANRFKKLAGIV